MPIIAMEPALKPASLLHENGVVLSLATPGTLSGEKYQNLFARFGEGVISLPCPGLMEFAERGELSGSHLEAFLGNLFAPYVHANVEAVVLGCTHYVFLKQAIGAFFPGVPLIDGNEGTVRQLIRRLAEKNLLAPADAAGSVELRSSGNGDAVQTMRRLLTMP